MSIRPYLVLFLILSWMPGCPGDDDDDTTSDDDATADDDDDATADDDDDATADDDDDSSGDDDDATADDDDDSAGDDDDSAGDDDDSAVGDDDDTVAPVDADGDGWDETVDCDDGDPALNLDDADGDGHSTCDGDCDDAVGEVHPGAAEQCNGVDDDCDGAAGPDEADADADGFMVCEGDCDDADIDVFPGAPEACNGIDDDCDGAPGAVEADADADGFRICEGDCDDADPAVFPGAPEACNGIDDDCDGAAAADEVDGDADGFMICDGDCDDGRPDAYPGAVELCNSLDDDCDGAPGAHEADVDGDGFRLCNGDCDDADAAVFPGAVEQCNGADDDCDGAPGADEADVDGDGYLICDGDCDDAEASVHPGAPEACNGVDDDCDGAAGADEVDADGDGFRICEGDCEDGDAAIHPGAAEACNGFDDDCDGSPGAGEVDDDGDGSMVCEGDCDDTDANIHPGAAEACNGIDDDCDGAAGADEVDDDADGFRICEGDCDDLDAAVHPGAGEICNGFDDDCDGVVDTGTCSALEFDGGRRVTVASTPDLDMSTAITMEAWFKFTSDPYSLTQPRAYLLDRSGSYRLWYSPDGDGYSVPDQFFCDLWSWEGVFTDHDEWEADRWYHIACSWDGATATVYVDGVAESSVSLAKTLPTTSADLTLGVGSEGNSGWIGLIDEVRVWNVARTEEQIREALCSLDGSEAGLAGGWDFEEGGGQVVADAFGLAGAGYLGYDAAVEADDPDWTTDTAECFGYEWCDGLDNDGDGEVDEDGDVVDAPAWYPDADGDGWGDGANPVFACAQPVDHLPDAGDCDDADPGVNPDAEDVCDGIDNNCDGLVDGHGASSLYFDGGDDMVHIGDDPTLDITGPITMEAWVYSENPNSDEPVLAKEYAGGLQQYWFGVYYGGFGLLLGDGSSWGLVARSSGQIDASTWTHLASVWDGATWSNYQDGFLVETGTYTGTVPVSDQPLTIGINSGYDNTRFQGYLTDVRLWNVARTQDQLRGDMFEIDDTTGLVGWWPMNETEGQTAFDESGYGFDGQLGNDPAADSRDPLWAGELPVCQFEWCDGVDNDGDGLIDDDDPDVLDPLPWYLDDDGDGYGAGVAIEACDGGAGYVENDDDCDDGDPASHPGADDLLDGLDNDCDGYVDEHGVTSLYFDGTNDMVWIGDDPVVDITGAITMEAWVNATNPSRDAPILAREAGSGQQQYWFGVYYGTFGLLLGNGTGWGLNERGSGTVAADTWYHLASVWDGATWTNYQDGVPVASGSYTGTPPSTAQPLTIGINSAFDSTRYQGYLTDVRLWNVARTDQEILDSLWGPADTTGLVAWWAMDDAAGQVAADAMLNGLDGQLGNDPGADDRDTAWSEELPER
jgi:hypothetical protein